MGLEHAAGACVFARMRMRRVSVVTWVCMRVHANSCCLFTTFPHHSYFTTHRWTPQTLWANAKRWKTSPTKTDSGGPKWTQAIGSRN